MRTVRHLQNSVGVLVGESNLWSEGLSFLEVKEGVGHDDDDVAHLRLAGCCAIETDTTAATLSTDNVGVEAFAVVVVDNVNAFTSNEADSVHEVFVDGDAAHVVEVGFSHLDAMQLRFQYFNLHFPLLFIVDVVDESDGCSTTEDGDAALNVVGVVP